MGITGNFSVSSELASSIHDWHQSDTTLKLLTWPINLWTISWKNISMSFVKLITTCSETNVKVKNVRQQHAQVPTSFGTWSEMKTKTSQNPPLSIAKWSWKCVLACWAQTWRSLGNLVFFNLCRTRSTWSRNALPVTSVTGKRATSASSSWIGPTDVSSRDIVS